MANMDLVFISANNADYTHAEQVLDFLQAHGVRAFLSSRSLPELGDSDYRKVIDEQLDRCRHMVVVTSSRERVESPWVEAEWGFFINAKRSRTKTGNIVTVTVGDLTPGELPPSLRYYEVVRLRADSLNRLLSYVCQRDGTETAETLATTERPIPEPAAALSASFKFGPKNACEARIKVFGVGGAGRAVVELMLDGPRTGMTTVLVTTDAQSAAGSRADIKLLIGGTLTAGLGSGSDPERGRQAAEHDADRLRAELAACDMVLLCAGLGGGTGTGATPVLARIARELGIVTICFVSLPFRFEGPVRARKASETVELLRALCDVVIPIPCDQALLSLAPNAPVSEAFARVADLQGHWATAWNSLVNEPGMVNVDFADLRSVFCGAGIAALGQGQARGAGRARAAVAMATSTGYLSDLELRRAGSVLLLVEGGPDLALDDLSEAAAALHDECTPEADIIIGSRLDPDLGDAVRAIVIATRFRD